jgi:thioredoxin reductase (NADPH)
MHRQVIIIGAGPAGIAAAIQLKRYGIETVIIEKNAAGGLLAEAGLVENFPGYAAGIKGAKLVSILKGHLKKLKIKIIFEEAQNILWQSGSFEITTNKSNFSSTYLVVASGTEPKKLPFDNNGKNIDYSVLPLLKLKNKSIAIIGAGDAAFDYAIQLSKKNKIFILNRGNQTRSLPLLFKRAAKIKNIHYLCGMDIEKEIYKYQRILAAIGRQPCLSFLKNDISDNRIFYAGDVNNGDYRQCCIAIGDGIRAAMQISNDIDKNDTGKTI